jgi:hypothetical protein
MPQKTPLINPPVESTSVLNFLWEDELLREKNEWVGDGLKAKSWFTQRKSKSSIKEEESRKNRGGFHSI